MILDPYLLVLSFCYSSVLMMCHYAEIVLHVCLIRAECYASSRLEQYSYRIHFLCMFYTLSVLPFGPGVYMYIYVYVYMYIYVYVYVYI